MQSTSPAGKVYSVSQNHIDLKYAEGIFTYYAGVLCGAGATRFSIMALLVKAEVHADTHESGEVCPDEWSYHFYKLTEVNASHNAADAQSDGHRRTRRLGERASLELT